jgi:hypothetical protein
LGGLAVLADRAAEYLPLPDWEVQRSGRLGFLAGRPLMAGLVRPAPVVMVGAFATTNRRCRSLPGIPHMAACGWIEV